MAADRFVLKQFAGSATNNGAFGAAQATGVGVQPVADIKDVQSLSAFEQGWNAATLTSDKLPALEEMQGLEALLCKALKENYSEGIPFWIAGETYFQYSFVNYNGVLYYNTTGSYTNNNPAIDTANWAAYDKVGTATVGSPTQGIYLDNGIPTAMTTSFADNDLSNLSATGEEHFTNPSLTNTPYTTNRIIEIPQDIKLELNSGTLTLKAGSKCFLKTDTTTPSVEVSSDLTTTQTTNGTYFAIYNGSALTTVLTSTYDYSSLPSTYSLPLAVVTVSGGAISSIDQIFNGFGFIGSTAFLLPGVKVQAPNGKNEDGTYITTSYDVTSVLTHTQISSAAGKIITEFLYSPDNLGGNSANLVKYDSDKNFMYSGSTEFTGVALFDITLDDNVKITKFEPKTVDSVANSNASNLSQAGRSLLSGLGMPSSKQETWTAGASGSTYTIPANGYFCLRGAATAAGGSVQMYTDNNVALQIPIYTTNQVVKQFIPVRKGSLLHLYYNNINLSTSGNFIGFVYAEGEN